MIVGFIVMTVGLLLLYLGVTGVGFSELATDFFTGKPVGR